RECDAADKTLKSVHINPRCFGSVGRAHRSHRWGHWFESSKHHHSPRSAMAEDFHILFVERKCPPCPNSSPARNWARKPPRPRRRKTRHMEFLPRDAQGGKQKALRP